MTFEETARLFALLEANYTDNVARWSKEVKKNKIMLWQGAFSEIDYPIVEKAVKNYMMNDNKSFFPEIGMINILIKDSLYPDMMTEQEATNTIMAALSDGYYNSRKAFNSLDPILQRLVGSPEQIKAWSLMEIDTVQSVIMSNVSRSYRVLAEKEKVHQRTAPYNPNQIGTQSIGELLESGSPKKSRGIGGAASHEEAIEFLRQIGRGMNDIGKQKDANG
jgi:hypothetical protein